MRFDFYKAYVPMLMTSLSRFADSIANIIYSLYYEYKGIPVIVGPPVPQSAGSAINVILSDNGPRISLALTNNGISEIIVLTPDMAGSVIQHTILGVPIAVLSMVDSTDSLQQMLEERKVHLTGKIVVVFLRLTLAEMSEEKHRVYVQHKTFHVTVSVANEPQTPVTNATDN
jgi:hypothetical protein